MSERIRKVSSLVKQIVAGEMARLPESGRYTVTRVDVTPDIRQATVWIGIVGDESLFKAIEDYRGEIQAAVAGGLETKFTPKLTFQHDLGGEHASHISRLIKGDSSDGKP
ncbi:MAG TPA: ribosome-binding factor A [Candidatus Saccharimonadales bacterium]|nr:ribosome-binding factor A [Candidatus Saccharimonadales bacterium]